jgi:hypothetical protein
LPKLCRLGSASFWVTLGVAAVAAASVIAPVENDGQVLARLEGFRFIQGKQLERLKSGQSVAYDFSLQLFDGPRSVGRTLERFVVSYDLWEENFSVTQLSPNTPKLPKAGASHLKLEALGDWCLERVRVPVGATERQKDLTLQFEVRSVRARMPNPLRAEGSVDLTTMVEIFSRPVNAQEYRFFSQSRSFRLNGSRQP